MLKKLKKRIQKKKTDTSVKTEIDFVLKKDFIYHIKNDVERLCIFQICEKAVFELTHDQNNHAGYNKTYHRLTDSVFIPKLSRKIRQYVKFCSICELNQTKKHAPYEKLVFIVKSTIFFRTIVMNFIVALSKKNGLSIDRDM